jgi:tRNA-modifying protein YgfZ
MSTGLTLIALAELGVLRARGPDAVAFLQGQLSCDVTQLSAARSLIAGYHNPQGRVIAVLQLLWLAADDVALVLPRELAAPVAQRLGKFVLRAKVRVVDDSAAWELHGLTQAAGPVAEPAAGAASLPVAVQACAPLADAWVTRLAVRPARWLVLSPVGNLPAPLAALPRGAPLDWRRLSIADGEPQVYAATSEEFVAQMLNLDVLGAVSFDKGCFTGQEVIARAHYRGRVKRRLQRFAASVPVPAPGSALELADGRTAKVVAATSAASGESEFLAVTTLAGQSGESPAPGGSVPLAARQLSLPYALPE